MRTSALVPTLALGAGLAAIATPSLAADLTVSVTVPRLAVSAYHRPYVAVWIERPDNTAVRTLAVWYQQTANSEGKGEDWLKDMRTWWRRGGNRLAMPIDGVSSATKAPGTHQVRVPGSRLGVLPAGDYVMVVEAARELGGREVVRVPFRWGAPNSGRASGSNELGDVSVAVTR